MATCAILRHIVIIMTPHPSDQQNNSLELLHPPDPEALLDEAQAAAFLGFAPRTLQAWRQRGGGPLYVRISSRAIRYRRRDLIAWVEKRLVKNTV